MKNFVVAIFNGFDWMMEMKKISASSKEEALFTVLHQAGIEPEMGLTEEEYEMIAFDADHAIKVIEI